MNEKEGSGDYRFLSQCACLNMRRANRAVTQFYDHALKSVGIKVTQFSILAVLANTKETTLADLASVLGMDRTTLTRGLQRLENEKLVVSRHGEDARERWIQLTQRGYAVLNSAIPLWQQAQSVIEDGFEAQFSDFLRMLSTSRQLASTGT